MKDQERLPAIKRAIKAKDVAAVHRLLMEDPRVAQLLREGGAQDGQPTYTRAHRAR